MDRQHPLVGCMIGAGIALAVLVANPTAARAQCCGCSTAPYVSLVGASTTTAVNAFTAAAITAQTAALIVALQGVAAQISANVRGTITGFGSVIEPLDSHQTERHIQDDRVRAMRAYQFSTPLCQAAATGAIAAAAASTSAVQMATNSVANAHRTSGTSTPLVAAGQARAERTPLACDAQTDPVCNGQSGTYPNADRAPGQVLATPGFHSADQETIAAWVANNLTEVAPNPPLTRQQVNAPGGNEAYMRRG